MLRILLNISLLSAAVTLTHASPVVKPDGKIVGGAETTIEEHPYQVSIEYYGLHICGGTLIMKKFIITAAHCVHGIEASKLYVRLGTTDRNIGGAVMKVDTIQPHESFTWEPLDFDVAVLTLTEDVEDVPTIASIDSLAPDTWPLEGDGTVTGWGYTDENGNLAAKLQSVVVPLVEEQKCRDIYPEAVTDSMFCAGNVEEGQVDACQGDSGGPLVQLDPSIPAPDERRVIVGIVSWGQGCGQIGKPGVYTSIPKVSVWLSGVLGIGTGRN